MTWFKVDDGWWSNPDTLLLSLPACGLWSKAGSYCGSRRDPFVSVQAVKMLGGTAKLAAELVAVGYWDEVDGGWSFHNWEEYQPQEAEREKWRDRKRKQRDKERDGHADVTETSRGVTELSGVPSRPDPETDTSTSHGHVPGSDARASEDEIVLAGFDVLGITSASSRGRVITAIRGCLPFGVVTDAEVVDVARLLLDLSLTHVTHPAAYIEKSCRDSPHEIVAAWGRVPRVPDELRAVAS